MPTAASLADLRRSSLLENIASKVATAAVTAAAVVAATKKYCIATAIEVAAIRKVIGVTTVVIEHIAY